MKLKPGQNESIKQFLIDKLNPYLIIIFGSAASHQMRPDSDIDVAYLGTENVGAYDLFMLAQDLADIVGRDVHLVDLRQAPTVLQAQIVSLGKVILDREPLKRQEFFMLVLKQYARLNEERAPILNKIRERGSIYVQ